MKNVAATVALFTVLNSTAFNALGNVTTQNQVWTGYYLQTDFSQKIFFYSELENRAFMKPAALNTFIIRNHLHFKVGKGWEVAPGFGYFLFGTQFPERKVAAYTPELRPFFDIIHTYKNNGDVIVLSNRLRPEARFVHKTAASQLAAGYNYSTRFRYRVQLDVLLFKSKNKDAPHLLKLRVNNELMINIPNKTVKNIYDQNRAYAGLHYQSPGPVAFEVGYMNLYQERNMGNEYFNRHLVRFSLFHKVSWPKKK